MGQAGQEVKRRRFPIRPEVWAWNDGEVVCARTGTPITAAPRGPGQPDRWYVGPFPMSEVVPAICRDGDELTAPRSDRGSIVFRSGSRSWRLRPATSWDADTIEELDDRAEQLAALDLDGAHPVGIVAAMLRRECKAAGWQSIPSRFRNLMADSMHQGPTILLRASAEHATQIDRRRAFLHGLAEDMPADRWLVAFRESTWRSAPHAFVRAFVRTPAPLLPVRVGLTTQWPVGVIFGCWSS